MPAHSLTTPPRDYSHLDRWCLCVAFTRARVSVLVDLAYATTRDRDAPLTLAKPDDSRLRSSPTALRVH